MSPYILAWSATLPASSWALCAAFSRSVGSQPSVHVGTVLDVGCGAGREGSRSLLGHFVLRVTSREQRQRPRLVATPSCDTVARTRLVRRYNGGAPGAAATCHSGNGRMNSDNRTSRRRKGHNTNAADQQGGPRFSMTVLFGGDCRGPCCRERRSSRRSSCLMQPPVGDRAQGRLRRAILSPPHRELWPDAGGCRGAHRTVAHGNRAATAQPVWQPGSVRARIAIDRAVRWLRCSAGRLAGAGRRAGRAGCGRWPPGLLQVRCSAARDRDRSPMYCGACRLRCSAAPRWWCAARLARALFDQANATRERLTIERARTGIDQG